MLKYTIKKLLMMIPMLLIISALIFFGMQATGIDPVNYLASPDMAANPELLEQLRESMGLNDPIIVQYFRWLGQMLTGNFGTSLSTGTPIASIIANYLPATLILSTIALILSTILGIALGIISAVRQNGIIDYIGRILAVLGQAVPQFIIGMILLAVFSVQLGWLPSSGRYSANAANPTIDAIQHLILPVIAVTISMCAVLVRYTRNSMLDIMNSDYIRLARSKGIPEWKVYIKHGFRNALRPVLVILVSRISLLFSGSVVVENVFAWPGVGAELTDAVVAGDYTVVMVLALVIAASVLVASFLLDIITALLDPRVRANL